MSLQWKKPEAEKIWKALERYKYVLLLLAAGAALLLWPTGEGAEPPKAAASAQQEDFDLAALERSEERRVGKECGS